MSEEYLSVMNETKWKEIKLLMVNYSFLVYWRTKDLYTQHISNWDGEWFYHFTLGGYKTIELLEIKVVEEEKFEQVLADLKAIHVPGKINDKIITIYGYQKDQILNYL
ncbi:hypothetical protein LFX25_19660 [Leptospira sp. FAT2]|uniref:DUF6678 family protein n=1 Tax=Leptospira sanjuanensis TaxID=2879643 RepID=UPI001EE7F8D7|nr:DUF6678 family protein [Leptospira sanjuanensis]MCG6170123.1 hypothetical protein [Leptospira sanjuanensis]MCG6195462.1 hypothetical protein [Leptospira sanjuanensis]